jgi:hypothetical protein
MTRQIVTLFPNNETVLGENRTNRGGSPVLRRKFPFEGGQRGI